MLGNGNRVVIELAEALAPVVPVDEPHFLFASDGAAAVEQALKIAFQFWTNQGVTGRTTYLAFGGAYHGDTIGSLSVGAGGFGTDVFDPLRFPVVRAPGFDDPAWLESAAAMVADHADRAGRRGRRAAGAGGGGHAAWPAGDLGVLVEACRRADVLLIADEVATGFGRTGTLVRVRAVRACGPTCCASARASPAATSRCRRPSPAAACSTRSSGPTSASGPSTTATPTAGTRWPPPSPCATCS